MNEQLTPVEGLMLRAVMYELLAVVYAYPGDQQRQRVGELASGLAPWVSLIHPDWSDRMGRIRESLETTSGEMVEAEFNRLFSGPMDCVPYETAYEPDIFRKQHTLADIAGFYRAFGFELPEGSRWQPDHVGVQMEYCSILLQRTAHALEQGWEEQAAICVDALRKFLLDHLGRWSDAFADDLMKAARTSFYQNLSEVTREWVGIELSALDREPDRLRSRQVYPEDAELPVCGGCTGCGSEGPTGPCSVEERR